MKADGGVITLLFVVIVMALGVVLLFNIVKSVVQPSETQAYITTAALADAIEKACKTGNTLSMPIRLGQSVASVKAFGTNFGKNVIPRYVLSYYGDPKILLYYEAFPPGEAVSWELFHDFGKRAVVYYKNPDADSVRSSNLKAIENMALARGYSSVVFGNLLLKNKEEKGLNFAGDAGKWSNEKNTYNFGSYETLGILNKTAVKYRLCGVNSLCLKTQNGIAVYPLDECTNAGINYVQLSTNQNMFKGSTTIIKGVVKLMSLTLWGKFLAKTAASVSFLSVGKLPSVIRLFGSATKDAVKAGIWSVIASKVAGNEGLIDDIATLFSAESNTDFYLASPCNAKLKIERTKCECRDDLPTVFFDDQNAASAQEWNLEGNGDDYTAKRLQDSGKRNIESIRCRHRINYAGRKEVEPDNYNYEKYEFPCIRITAEEYEGFCFSKFMGTEGSSEYPLYQSASVSMAQPDVIILESSRNFDRPSFTSTGLGAAAYSWP